MIEQNCTFEHEGRTYESGGAYLVDCPDGKMRGVVYVQCSDVPGHPHKVTTWHGDFIAYVALTDYQGNFCKMRRVSFTYKGRKFVGDYCPDWADAVKVRSTK